MQEIKFRFWNGQKMLFYELFSIPKNISYIGAPMQYTNLKDKKDVEIYEGDILRVRMGTDWQIKPQIVENIYDIHLWENEDDPYRCVNEVEVIGNIYENPELIFERG